MSFNPETGRDVAAEALYQEGRAARLSGTGRHAVTYVAGAMVDLWEQGWDEAGG